MGQDGGGLLSIGSWIFDLGSLGHCWDTSAAPTRHLHLVVGLAGNAAGARQILRLGGGRRLGATDSAVSLGKAAARGAGVFAVVALVATVGQECKCAAFGLRVFLFSS